MCPVYAKPTYGVYVSQLIRISRICDNYVSFVKRHRLLTERLIKQGFWYNKLSVSFKKFSRRHSMLFNKYAVSVKRHIREGISVADPGFLKGGAREARRKIWPRPHFIY